MKSRLFFLFLILVLSLSVLSCSSAETDIDALIAAEDYMEAFRLLDEDGSEVALIRKAELQRTVYDMGKAALTGGDPAGAAVLFVQLGNYEDAAGLAFLASSNRTLLTTHEVGDILSFGRYEQDGNTENGPEPIEWIILDIRDGEMLLLSRYMLDTVQYSDSVSSDLSWESSLLHSWLNETFFASAFSDSEKITLRSSGPDPVFVLTLEELQVYLPSISDCRAVPTAYAISQDAWKNCVGYGYWWLKDVNPKAGIAQFVTSDGSPAWYYVNAHRRCVRPAIRINPLSAVSR